MPAERRTRPRRKPRAPAGEAVDGPIRKVLPLEQRNPEGLPGVNKIKNQLRQTRRLLAKDNLEPALRVQTQRRLTALEADLSSAEKRGVEQKNGAKYHAVKFFERQKLMRIVKRAQRKIKEAEEGAKGDKKKAKAETELEETRVMLNYVVNYPNTQKYIALFPSAPAAKAQKGDDKESLKLPAHLSVALDDESLDKPGRKRLEMLIETRRLMQEGKLSSEPEVAERKKAAVEIAPGTSTGKEVKKQKDEAKVDEDDFFDDSE